MDPHTATFQDQVGEGQLVVQRKRETTHLDNVKCTQPSYIGNNILFLSFPFVLVLVLSLNRLSYTCPILRVIPVPSFPWVTCRGVIFARGFPHLTLTI